MFQALAHQQAARQTLLHNHNARQTGILIKGRRRFRQGSGGEHGFRGSRQRAHCHAPPRLHLYALPMPRLNKFARFPRHAAEIIGRLAHQIALPIRYAHVNQRRQFLAGFRTLRQNMRSDVARIAEQARIEERGAPR